MNQPPNFNKTFFCIFNRKKNALAAVISSYVHINEQYTVAFEFPKVTVSLNDAGNENELNSKFISKVKGTEFNTLVHNALCSLGGCDFLVLGGLDEEQISYLTFLDNYNLVTINELEDVDLYLGDLVEKDGFLRCGEHEIYEGLYLAAQKNLKLSVGQNVGNLIIPHESKDGLIVIERTEDTSAVLAVNYALSVNASISIIEAPKLEIKEVKYLIEKWKRTKDDSYYNELSALIYCHIENIEFKNFSYATFFTIGIPYSLIMQNIIPFTYVNTRLRPDFFVFNNILIAHDAPYYSAIVFSPLEFISEETDFVVNKLNENKYFVRKLIGENATVFNLGQHVEYYPYEIIHLCSHGGKINGFSLVEEFTDRNGVSYTVEYDEVVSFAPNPDSTDGKIEVTSKHIWRTFEGYDWGSKELKEKNYPSYVFDDMVKELRSIRGKSRKEKYNIENSCHVKCVDFNYQAMFNMIAGGHSKPFVFNNTCWSWFDISESFIYSGATSYIGTLWSISNGVAKNVAEFFYEKVFEDKTVLNALFEAYDYTYDEDLNIYIFWGLHFSKLKKGNSIRKSKLNIAYKLYLSIAIWQEHLINVEDQRTRDTIYAIIDWNKIQLKRYFFWESLKIFFDGI